MKKHSRLWRFCSRLMVTMFTACTNRTPDSTTPAPQSDTTSNWPDVTTDPNQTNGGTVDLTGYEFTICTNDVFPETDETASTSTRPNSSGWPTLKSAWYHDYLSGFLRR